jgi:hypothetical protein
MIPTPFDALGFVVQRLAKPGAVQQKEISGAASPLAIPHHKPSAEADLILS